MILDQSLIILRYYIYVILLCNLADDPLQVYFFFENYQINMLQLTRIFSLKSKLKSKLKILVNCNNLTLDYRRVNSCVIDPSCSYAFSRML